MATKKQSIEKVLEALASSPITLLRGARQVGFISRIEKPVIIDEIQRVPECSKDMILKAAFKGGYPRPLSLDIESAKHAWFNDYVALILQKDILDDVEK